MNKVLVDVDHQVVKLTLNDPDTLNALDAEMADELREAVRFIADPARGFRCLVLTGAGRGFCSGGNLGWMDSSNDGEPGETSSHNITLGSHHHFVLRQLKDLPFPIITAVNGPAAGLGFSYALAGDLVVAARSAFFVASFSTLGVSSDGGLSWLLPRLVGWARAKELLLLGRRLAAETALEWGLVNQVIDDENFEAQVMSLARELAAGPTVALGVLRQLYWEAWTNSFQEHLDLEERLQPRTFATEDAREGVRARLERRPATFQGR